MTTLLDNGILLAAVVAWLLAQSIKIAVDLIRTRRVNFRHLVSAGGMPSAHSALVTSLATGVARDQGVGSSLFALSAAFAAIVMYDAAGVRQAASVQARILNRMLDELFTQRSFNERRLRELLGHTPVEVFVGALLGLVVGLLWPL